MSAQSKLAIAFNERNLAWANRSSAIFPASTSSTSDQIIVFINYWSIKNNIDDVICNIRLYDESGSLQGHKSFKLKDAHHQVSIKDTFAVNDFRGMFDVEFISTQNLRFPFPGILCFYQSKDCLSVVHSAGRVRNSDESRQWVRSIESNLSCKTGKDVTPFFHVFNGPTKLLQPMVVEVSIYDKFTKQIAAKSVTTKVMNSYSSQILFLKDIFPNELPEGSHVRIALDICDIYPRLIVGNYFKKIDFYEVTHSFPVTTIDDYVTKPTDTDYRSSSFLTAMTAPGLELDYAIFPTNAEGIASGDLKTQKIDELTLKNSAQTVEFNSGYKTGEFWHRTLPEDTLMETYFISGDKVPSRINTSYRYKVKNGNDMFSTDIATGAKSWIYPAKHSHWGHGVISKDWKTTLIFRNIAHRKSNEKDTKGTLTLYFKDQKPVTTEVKIISDSTNNICLNDLVDAKMLSSDPNFISWFFRCDGPAVEVIWVAHTPDGRICGEHSF